VVAAGVVAGVVVGACGGGGTGGGADGGGGDQGSLDGGTIDAVDAATPEVARPDAGGGELALDFHVVYTLLGRIAGVNLAQSDLRIMRADGEEARSLTDFFTGEDAAYNCHHSCIVDDDLTWLAVAQGPPDENGFFTFDMGRFGAAGTVSIVKGAPLTGVVDLHFGREYLYYTKLSRQEGPSRQFAVWRVPLARPADRQVVTYFPPDDVLADSTYAGRFRANPVGEQLVFLNPTIRSQSVYVWRDGALDQIDYICPYLRSGQCQGAGSEYSDQDPLAISPDGRYVALFVVSGSDLRIRLYDLTDLTTKPYKVLARVADGQTYYANICASLEDWQFAEVTGQPRFHASPDGTLSLYYIGLTDPRRPGCTVRKIATDILRIDVETILAPRTLEPSDIDNITRTPKTGDAHQIAISAFDVSPDGTVLVFAGTPSFQENGQLITGGSTRHQNDEEIWVQGSDGTGRRQVTNDKSWRATTPVALP
jgi:hypothetical protein